MATWDELREHMRKTYQLADDEGDMLSMVWSYDDGRSQKIIIRRYEAFDRPLVELKSAFGRTGDADAEAMLRKNAELPLATVALTGDVYMVVYNALLDHLDFQDLDLYLSRVAAVADTLEEAYANKDMF
jgi:hypothetical protein